MGSDRFIYSSPPLIEGSDESARKRKCHETFSERVLELRLQKARAMFASRECDHLRVNETAYACGFNDVSYFNRCFRRRFGATPTVMRGENGAS